MVIVAQPTGVTAVNARNSTLCTYNQRKVQQENTIVEEKFWNVIVVTDIVDQQTGATALTARGTRRKKSKRMSKKDCEI